MPSNRRSLAVTARYHSDIAGMAHAAATLVARRWERLPREEIASSFRDFVGEAAELIAGDQDRAALRSVRFMGDLAQLEVGSRDATDPLDRNAGRTADGRALEEAIAATPAKVMLALKQGRTIEAAMRFGQFSIARLAQTEVMDAARLELRHQMTSSKQVRGWHWRSRGTCGACLGMDDGRTRKPGASLNGHPYCKCIQEPVFDVPQRVTRQTGAQRFESLSEAEKESALGPAGAALVGAGLLDLSQVIAVEQSQEWRSVVTLASVESMVAQAGISQSDLDQLIENRKSVA